MSLELSRLALRQSLTETDSYLADPIFPTHAMHVMTGPPDMGKTTLLFQQLHDYDHGREMLGGFPVRRVPWAYVALDRGMRDINRTMHRLGLRDWDAPVFGHEDVAPRNASGRIDAEPDLIATIKRMMDAQPKLEFFVFEGLQGYLPNQGRGQSLNKAHAMWMMQVRDLLLNRGITILAVTHTPKSSDAVNDRENMLGSQGLIGALGTVVKFDLPPTSDRARGVNGATDNGDRLITYMPKNSPRIYLHTTRGDRGEYILVSRQDKDNIAQPNPSNTNPNSAVVPIDIFQSMNDAALPLEHEFSKTPAQAELTLKVIKLWAQDHGLGENVVKRWVDSAVDRGALLREGAGKFRKSASIA